MDSFLSSMSTTDTKDRLTLGAQLLEYLADESNSLVCSDVGSFVDGLILWLQSSNFKIVQLDLDIITEFIQRTGADFQPYTSALLPHLVDKLGDSKEVIREKTLITFRKLIENRVLTPQNLFDRVALPCFTHKNSNAREQILHMLVETLNTYGASSLVLSKLIPYIVKLLGDPNLSVRQTAFETLCELYKHVGERLKVDLQKKYSVPQNKLPALMAKFNEIKVNDTTSSLRSMSISRDETDRACPSIALRPAVTSSALSASYAKKSMVTQSAGALNEDIFANSFEDVPKIQIYSGHDVQEYLQKCEIVEKTNEDWKKRVSALKSIRSVIVAGGLDYEEFHASITNLLPALEVALKDLRSQVVREACITVAYLSKRLENKFDRLGETILPYLINLIQNSAKVMASSGLVCVLIVLQHTQTPRFIPIVADGLKSKSKEIRRACCKFINFMLQTWPITLLEKHAGVVQEVIKKGITDADAEARLHARNSYADFSVYFPEMAESLKNSLDQTSRKMLFSTSHAGSNSSLSKIDCKPSLSTARAHVSSGCRSTSAIDLQAAKKAKSRAVERSKCIAIPPRRPVTESRQSRSSNRTSVSQPTSRSGSPSSRANRSVDETPRSRRSSTDNNASRNNSLNRSSPGFKSMLPVRKSSVPQKSQNGLPPTNGNHFKSEEHDSMSYDSGISQMSSGEQIDLPDCQKDCETLKLYIDELSSASDEKKLELLESIKKLVKEGASDMIVTNFKLLLGRIIALISDSQSPSIKTTTLSVLQTIVKRKTVSFLLKEFSELIIIRVISVSADESREVSKAAESCALTLSVHLPYDAVIRVVVPLVTSEATTMKLVSLKMLTRVIECLDDAPLTPEYVDQIMPVLLAAYDDPESIIRKGAVFCIVALHKHSEETRAMIQPFIHKLQKPKQKLLDLYIRRAEHGSSMPTSPQCG